MQIQLDEIGEEGLDKTFLEQAESFEELNRLVEEEEFHFVSPIEVKLHAVRVGDLIEIEGTMGTRLATSCSRCLKDVSSTLEVPFELTFQQQVGGLADLEEEVELTADELGLVEFSGDSIDLKASLQEQVLLALPQQPLCREDCRGLCPQCGADLNTTTCSCSEAAFDSRFAALKKLKLDQ